MSLTTKSAEESGGWTFLSNYAHVLVCLHRDPTLTLREVSGMVGITERAVQRIVGDLAKAEVIVRVRDGRRNRYQVNSSMPLRHPLEESKTIGQLLKFLGE